MMRLIYTICSKNLANKDFHKIFSENDRKLIRCKEANSIWEKKLVSRSKSAGTHKYPENFPQTFMTGTSVLKCLKPRLVLIGRNGKRVSII